MRLSPEELQAFAPLLRSLTVDGLRRAFNHALSYAVEHDPDELERIAACGRELPPEDLPAAWLRMRLEAVLSESEPGAEEIDHLYAKLHRPSESPSPENEARFQETLARLRAAQHREAERLAEEFRARGHLSSDEVDRTIAEARALLNDSSSRNRSGG